MLPESDHWPPDDAWAYHDWHTKSGGDINHFMNALTEELGAPTSLEDFERKSQLLTYASHRAMFEGFNAHLWEPNTGRLMWMSHPAWPSMEWQMYSSDYSTHGAFFGVKKACEPVHAQLDEPDASITVVNNTTRPLFNLRLITRVVDVSGVGISTREDTVSAPTNAAVRVFRLDIPQRARDGVVFVRLTLADSAGRVLSERIIWFMQRLGVPNGLRAVGYSSSDIPALVEGTSLQRRLTALAPRQAGDEELSAMFEDAMVIW